MKKLLAVIIVIVWMIIGFIAGIKNRNHDKKVNIAMIIFLSCAPFLTFLELLL